MANAALDIIALNYVARLSELADNLNRGLLDECSPEVLTALEDGVRDLMAAATARRTFIAVQATSLPPPAP